jgi:formylglycine-generating enzyme required for sulfatase activity
LKAVLNCLRRGNRHSNLATTHNPERILDWLSGAPVKEINVDPVRMIVISEELETQTVAADANIANDSQTVDLIHEILLRESRATGQPYCKTLSQWVAENWQQLKNRNLRKQLTQRWLNTKQKSPWSALFNDLANTKQIKDFLAAGSCTEDEKRFIKASINYSRVFNATIALLVLLFVSLGFAANGMNFTTQKTKVIDLPIAWLRAQLGWKIHPNLVAIPAGPLKIENQSKTIPAFRMADTEVTFAEYDIFVYSQNSEYVSPWSNVSIQDSETCVRFPDDEGWGRGSRPVINVSWHCAKAYIDWLNTGLQTHQPHYKLSSETQWEYAIRAGTSTDYFWETSADNTKTAEASATEASSGKINDTSAMTATEYAWFSENSDEQTHPVKQLKHNDFQLYDMAGNVWEWTQDCWHEDYENAPDGGTAREGQSGGDCKQRVLRGGSWNVKQDYLRSANRYWNNPDYRTSSSVFVSPRTNPLFFALLPFSTLGFSL